MRSTKTFATLAALGGILQLVLGIVAYLVDASTVLPDLGQPARVQAAHLATHPPGVVFWSMVSLETAGLVLFLAFAAYLAQRLGEAGAPAWLAATAFTARAPRWLAATALIGGVAAVAAGFGFDSGQLGSIAIMLAAAAWLLRSTPTTTPGPARTQRAVT